MCSLFFCKETLHAVNCSTLVFRQYKSGPTAAATAKVLQSGKVYSQCLAQGGCCLMQGLHRSPPIKPRGGNEQHSTNLHIFTVEVCSRGRRGGVFILLLIVRDPKQTQSVVWEASVWQKNTSHLWVEAQGSRKRKSFQIIPIQLGYELNQSVIHVPQKWGLSFIYFLLKGRVSIVFNVKAVQHHMTNERVTISSAAVVQCQTMATSRDVLHLYSFVHHSSYTFVFLLTPFSCE